MEKREVRVTRVKATSVGLFEGVFALVVGFVVACAAWFSDSAGYTGSTNSLLHGLMLGLGTGLLAVIVLPIIYFVAGWVVGTVHGALFNVAASWMGSVDLGSEPADETAVAEDEIRQAAPTRRAEPTFGETISNRRDDQ